MKQLSFFLILFTFFNSANAQDSLIISKVYSDDCGLDNKVNFWIDSSVARSDISLFTINDSSYSPSGVHSFSIDYGQSIYSIEIEFAQNSGYINFTKYFQLPVKKPEIYLSQELIDSAQQNALIKINYQDSNELYDSIELKIFRLYNQNGQASQLPIFTKKESALGGVNFEFSLSLPLPPGKYRATQNIILDNSCILSSSKSFWIGNLMAVRVNDNGYIHDSVYYWHKGGNSFCETVNWWENTSCIDTSGFFYNPDSNSMRKYWHEHLPNYQGSYIKEGIFYDFNSDGIIDLVKPILQNPTWVTNSSYKPIRIPEKYQQDTLTVWSRDSLGQWQKSEPIPYTNCSQFARWDNFVLENDDSLAFYHEAQRPIGYSKFTTVLYHQTFVGNDTSYTPYDTIEYHWLEQTKAATRFGYNLIKTWSNNTVCDEPKFDTIYSCIGFRRSAEFKVEGDSVILNNTSFEGYHDSVLLKVKNEKNELVDSVWVSKIDYYVKTLSNGTYTAFINSNSPCDTIETIKFEITTSSLANLMSFKIDIFPNPVTSHATVLFNYSKGNYSILDLTGRKVSKGVLTKGSNEIKLTHIPKGVYIIEISQNQSVYRTRLVKE